MPRVFVSYSWDSDEHKQRVLALVEHLRGEGVDAWLDRFTPFPEQGWPRWMADEIKSAELVLVVATAKYAERFAGRAPAGTGLGATWEGAIITQELYESSVRNTKFLPVIFSDADKDYVPTPLRSFTHYRADTEDGYTALYRQLTGQPEVVPARLGAMRKLPAGTSPGGSGATPRPALSIPEVHDHAAARSNLPRLPYGFFGREKELAAIADALAPLARTWGALIDGPGGIGKTALAIRSAELTPPGQFERILFLSAKSNELTADGKRTLSSFVFPAYREMLAELARELGVWDEAKAKEEGERPPLLQRALQGRRWLLIFDNLETLPGEDRDRLFEFLSRLPGGCKALVTSRRRSDVDARVLRLDKLERSAALALMGELEHKRPELKRASEDERILLYERTGGNPLLIRWVVGQLGRGRCRTVAATLDLLQSAPVGNDPLEFVFGDLADSFSETETKVLAALCHFTLPIAPKFIAELAGITVPAAEAALGDLADRALITSDAEAREFVMMPLVSAFLHRARPEAVRTAGNRLVDHVYALAVENGYRKYDRFPILESAWAAIAASLPLLLQGENGRLQTVCDALQKFLEFYGHWDDWLSLSDPAERKAVAANEYHNAGWHAYGAGFIHSQRGEPQQVLACAERAAEHWNNAKSGIRERAVAIVLRGLGHRLAKDYAAAIVAFREALELFRSRAPESVDVSIGLSDLADAERLAGDFVAAEWNYRESLRIAKAVGFAEGIASRTGNLAALALDREDWSNAETLAREALVLAEGIGRKELIASNCGYLAKALSRQGKKQEALPYAQRAVTLLTELRSRDLDWARGILEECRA